MDAETNSKSAKVQLDKIKIAELKEHLQKAQNISKKMWEDAFSCNNQADECYVLEEIVGQISAALGQIDDLTE